MKTLVLLHGRGANSSDMLVFSHPDYETIAPQAENLEWYPKSFLADKKENEPKLSESISVINGLLKDKNPADTVLLGFSQGACLILEYAYRYPARYKGIIALSGGLIGKTVKKGNGDFKGTPVFLGCSENDPYIPKARVDETEKIFKKMGAIVEKRIYPGSSHTVNQDEFSYIKERLDNL